MKYKIILSVLCLLYIGGLIFLPSGFFTPSKTAGHVFRALLELMTIPVILAVPAQIIIYGVQYFRAKTGSRPVLLAPLIINMLTLIIMILATVADL